MKPFSTYDCKTRCCNEASCKYAMYINTPFTFQSESFDKGNCYLFADAFRHKDMQDYVNNMDTYIKR